MPLEVVWGVPVASTQELGPLWGGRRARLTELSLCVSRQGQHQPGAAEDSPSPEPKVAVSRRDPWGDHGETAQPEMCLGREEERGEFQALTIAPVALLQETAGPATTHRVSSSLHGSSWTPSVRVASGSLVHVCSITCGWPRPPGLAEEGGKKGGKDEGRGGREEAELASHFPSSLIPPL